MRDPRYDRLAKVLVDYCLDVRRGDLVLIRGGLAAAPLMKEVYREALVAGGHPYVRPELPSGTEIFYKTARKHQLEFMNPISRFEIDKIDKLLSIRGAANTKALTNVDPKAQSTAMLANRSIRDRYRERAATGELEWCVTQFPCSASAQDAEMSLSEYEDFILRACFVHLKDPVAAWKRLRRRQAKLVKALNEVRTLRIVREDTDLSMSVEGRTWINSDGRTNMPSGEVFTGPIEDSVEGKIAFSFPACYRGREVQGVRLTFRKGKVVKATADKGQEFLHATLDTDDGARFVGEIAVGTNYAIERFTKNTLFDEKIGGTVHLAVGASYAKSGGLNKSSIHWDMITDMREGGKIYADGKIIYKDGEFTLDQPRDANAKETSSEGPTI